MGHTNRPVTRASRWTRRMDQMLCGGLLLLVAATTSAAQNADDTDPPAFSFGGRRIDGQRRWMAEPYSPEPAPTPVATPPTAPQLLEPPAVVPPGGQPETPALNPTSSANTVSSSSVAKRADLIPVQENGAGAARANALITPGKAPTVVPASSAEPQLMPQANPAPLIVYQPMALPTGVPTTQPAQSEPPLATTIALLAAGFAAGVALVLSVTLLPVAIALRRHAWPTNEPTASGGHRQAVDSAMGRHAVEASHTTRRPLDSPPPTDNLAQRQERERNESPAGPSRQASALFAHVLDENLALQDQLRRANQSDLESDKHDA